MFVSQDLEASSGEVVNYNHVNIPLDTLPFHVY